jgi:hypothetical protein
MFRSQPLDQLFSMDDFLADVEASVRPFLERLTTTQVLLLQLVMLLVSLLLTLQALVLIPVLLLRLH